MDGIYKFRFASSNVNSYRMSKVDPFNPIVHVYMTSKSRAKCEAVLFKQNFS